jgi:RNA polymerase-interacting CarD/CdnL/TRCF family regulator
MYYEISTEKTTIWVPVDAQERVGLRRVTAKRELERYRAILKSRPVPLDAHPGKRQMELAERFKQGSLELFCEIVRDLTAQSAHKPLANADATALRKAREGLEQEWAAAEGVSVAAASREIDELLGPANMKKSSR